ncbi:MAG: class I SAM-dependent methyltransferase [Syntrophobacteria bacterium]
MSRPRRARRRYYDVFAHVYDAFIRLHSRRDEDDTRNFLVAAAGLEDKPSARILDICCGTGSVILTFAERYHRALLVGFDFSPGMLSKARERDIASRVIFIEGDAVELPFADESFAVVTCSHALYELKGEAREKALSEMRRVLHPDGLALLMEHEVPRHPLVRLLFYVRLFFMGSRDAREFLKGGLQPFRKVFSRVSLSHSRSGKSKLISCQK